MQRILSKLAPFKKIVIKAIVILGILFFGVLTYFTLKTYQENKTLKSKLSDNQDLASRIEKELADLKGQDQLKLNLELKAEIAKIEKNYQTAALLYEDLLNLKEKTKDTKELDKLYAEIISLLSKKDWKQAEEKIQTLRTKISEEETKIAATVKIPENVTQSNTPPSSGYSRQQVSTDAGSFMVSMMAADLSSTKVIVDTASDATCTNECPVLPLATYASRNGAFAGVNGTYFCPVSYPSCAGKTNSFDLLVMNKNKTYFNSDNNVYSNNPAVIFGNGYIRFVGRASEWGRDTGIDSMLSNYPLLIAGGNIVYSGDGDAKHISRGGRSFVATKGSTVYIGVVHSASVSESAKVLKALGMGEALNLDNGGSTALWNGGYKVGPGRDIPNAILFVKK